MRLHSASIYQIFEIIFLQLWCHRLAIIFYYFIQYSSSQLYFPVSVENMPLGLSDRLPAMLNRLFGLKTARFPP